MEGIEPFVAPDDESGDAGGPLMLAIGAGPSRRDRCNGSGLVHTPKIRKEAGDVAGLWRSI